MTWLLNNVGGESAGVDTRRGSCTWALRESDWRSNSFVFTKIEEKIVGRDHGGKSLNVFKYCKKKFISNL